MDSVRGNNSVQHSSQVFQTQHTQNTARNEASVSNNTSKAVFNPQDNVSLSAGSKYGIGVAVSKYGIFVPQEPGAGKPEPGAHLMYGVFHDPIDVKPGPEKPEPGAHLMYGIFHDPIDIKPGPEKSEPGAHLMYGIFHDPIDIQPGPGKPEITPHLMYGIFLPENPIEVLPEPQQPETPEKPDPHGPQMMYGAFPHFPGIGDGGVAVPMYGFFHQFPGIGEGGSIGQPGGVAVPMYGAFPHFPGIGDGGSIGQPGGVAVPMYGAFHQFPGIGDGDKIEKPKDWDIIKPMYGVFPDQKRISESITKLGQGSFDGMKKVVENAAQEIRDKFGIGGKEDAGAQKTDVMYRGSGPDKL